MRDAHPAAIATTKLATKAEAFGVIAYPPSHHERGPSHPIDDGPADAAAAHDARARTIAFK